MRTSSETYAAWLRRHMDEQQLTQRSLARLWMPDDPETARRYVRRYLKGVVPIQRTREALARVLGVDDTGPEPDASEDD